MRAIEKSSLYGICIGGFSTFALTISHLSPLANTPPRSGVRKKKKKKCVCTPVLRERLPRQEKAHAENRVCQCGRIHKKQEETQARPRGGPATGCVAIRTPQSLATSRTGTRLFANDSQRLRAFAGRLVGPDGRIEVGITAETFLFLRPAGNEGGKE